MTVSLDATAPNEISTTTPDITVDSLPVDTCLQCEQTRVEVKGNDTICGIAGGYEYVELVAEWDAHHWRDWSDKELASTAIRPEFYEVYRRVSASYFEWVACEHSTFGHQVVKEDDPDYGVKAGDCFRCGKTCESITA